MCGSRREAAPSTLLCPARLPSMKPHVFSTNVSKLQAHGLESYLDAHRLGAEALLLVSLLEVGNSADGIPYPALLLCIGFSPRPTSFPAQSCRHCTGAKVISLETAAAKRLARQVRNRGALGDWGKPDRCAILGRTGAVDASCLYECICTEWNVERPLCACMHAAPRCGWRLPLF